MKGKEVRKLPCRRWEQRQEASWKPLDAGTDDFDRNPTVTANKKWLFTKNVQAIMEIAVNGGRKIEDFAPWHYLNAVE